MSTNPRWNASTGPFRADQIKDGEPYELSNGHKIYCMSAGERQGSPLAAGALALATAAPSPKQVGIDVGVAWNDGKNLRAPHLSVGLLPFGKLGWSTEAPSLAIEYADIGHDEDELTCKIAELLELGTRLFWVIRLDDPMRVEIHERGAPTRIVDADATLTAPGILEYAIPVRALIDRTIAAEAALHNTLARKGYRDLEAVREEGRNPGLEQAREVVRTQIRSRGWTAPPVLDARITACADIPTLMRWLLQSATATDPESALR